MRRLEPKLNQIQIQDRYVEAVEAAYSRWHHTARRGRIQGHYDRRVGLARKQAMAALKLWRLTDAQIAQALRDANDIVSLRRHAEEE